MLYSVAAKYMQHSPLTETVPLTSDFALCPLSKYKKRTTFLNNNCAVFNRQNCTIENEAGLDLTFYSLPDLHTVQVHI